MTGFREGRQGLIKIKQELLRNQSVYYSAVSSTLGLRARSTLNPAPRVGYTEKLLYSFPTKTTV